MKFSVIIPTYNYGHFITACLNSVLLQTYDNWECLIMDNASTDDTENKCASFLNDQRFIYHRLPENNGPSVARNKALQKATGDYVLFLDADDLIEKDKLKSAFHIISQHQSDLVFTDHAFFKTSPEQPGTQVSMQQWFKPGIIDATAICNELVDGNVFVISSPVTRKALLDKTGYFDASIRYNEDWELWLRLSLQKIRYYYDQSDNVKTLIRDHGSSHSKDEISMYLSGIYVCKKHMPAIPTALLPGFKLKLLSQRYLLTRILFERFKNGQMQRTLLLKKLTESPLAKGELLFSRQILAIIPKFIVPMYLFAVKVRYVILRKCL